VVALVAVAAYGFGGQSAPPDGVGPDATTIVEVTRMDLVDYQDATGEVGFGPVTTLRYTPPPPGGAGESGDAGTGDAGTGDADGGAAPAEAGLGLVTWLPPAGSTVDRGGTLFRVDEAPVVLLIGALPVYRKLRTGVTGADVRQVEENLAALGVSGFTVDDQYTDATATAVRRWQKGLGLPETGEITPGQVVYAAGPVRIADHRLRVGDVATGDVVGVTGTARVATATIDTVALGLEIEPGSEVRLLFGDSSEVPAAVRTVGPVPADPQAPLDAARVVVEVEVADQALLADREGPVTMRFVVAERHDVLAVPVVALVALAEGGYGVQVVEGSTTRYVAVETGLFARGYVEIVSGDLRPGMTIVVPS
jgi:peptidoglycan hydrolase-like protein with peptidoglycan-binding domain